MSVFLERSEFLFELILNCATKASCPNTLRLWRMNSARSNCAAPLRRNAAPLMRRCLSLEHVCKHTAVNKCANRGSASAESRVALCCFGHEAAAVVCCFSSLCVRSPEPRHQIVAAGRKNPPHSYLRWHNILLAEFARTNSSVTLKTSSRWSGSQSLCSALNLSSFLVPFLKLLTSNCEQGTMFFQFDESSVQAERRTARGVLAFALLIYPPCLSAAQLAPIVRTLRCILFHLDICVCVSMCVFPTVHFYNTCCMLLCLWACHLLTGTKQATNHCLINY